MEVIATAKTSKRSEAGFSLVEIMVAIVIVLVGLLGLIQMLGMTATHNIKNQLREEAVMLGEEQMAFLLRLPKTSLDTPFDTVSSASRLRGSSKKFFITRTASEIPNSSSYQLTVKVGWTYKEASSNHEVQAMRTFDEE